MVSSKESKAGKEIDGARASKPRAAINKSKESQCFLPVSPQIEKLSTKSNKKGSDLHDSRKEEEIVTPKKSQAKLTIAKEKVAKRHLNLLKSTQAVMIHPQSVKSHK